MGYKALVLVTAGFALNAVKWKLYVIYQPSSCWTLGLCLVAPLVVIVAGSPRSVCLSAQLCKKLNALALNWVEEEHIKFWYRFEFTCFFSWIWIFWDVACFQLKDQPSTKMDICPCFSKNTTVIHVLSDALSLLFQLLQLSQTGSACVIVCSCVFLVYLRCCSDGGAGALYCSFRPVPAWLKRNQTICTTASLWHLDTHKHAHASLSWLRLVRE